jgi:phenylpyruvate tautomerase PptA (4-oxalocrotonate tautomerase family)
MPLTRISLRKGTSPAHRRHIMDAIYQAQRDTFGVPEDDRFMVIDEYDAANFDYGRHYLDIDRTDALVLIQMTVSNTRTPDQKRALFAAICHNLVSDAGLRPQDVFINLVEVEKVNWSFGHGVAQYA